MSRKYKGQDSRYPHAPAFTGKGVTAEGLTQMGEEMYQAFKKGVLESHGSIRASHGSPSGKEKEFFGGCIQFLMRWATEEGVDFEKALTAVRESDYAKKWLKSVSVPKKP